jgi:hypothetical protein
LFGLLHLLAIPSHAGVQDRADPHVLSLAVVALLLIEFAVRAGGGHDESVKLS